MEAFSNIVSKACSLGHLKGISLPNEGPVISHLLYADDALLVGEWSEHNIKMVARILWVFFGCSGLKINFHKSNLFGVGVGEEEIENMVSVVGCRRGSAPFKYLGIPLGANMNRVNNWDPVVAVFRNRLATWKSKSLLIGGRVVLIKAVLESLPIYFFSIFKVPVKVVEKLESLMKNFLLGGSEEVKKMHWVVWDKVAFLKKFGGLGIWKLRLVNDALLSKWVWGYRTEEEGLWRRVIRACHEKNSRWSVVPAKSNSTDVWKNISRMESKFMVNGKRINNFINGVLGNGTSIRFWIDCWLGDVP
ncbi:putative RNA-directed DNA polymerase [Helianthus annuus]|nr:putative RNA-directed DNA polymerase [Helianthus annuus]